ncbi:MAG: pilus assembly protein [Hespellia sp.]|nr:pilus assembly protein [Hespellia sp.]
MRQLSTIHLKSQRPHSGRASVFVLHQKKRRGSVTVGAALAIPLFLFASLCIIYIMEIMSIESSIKAGVSSAGKLAAKELYLLPIVNVVKLQSDIVNAVGSEKLDQSIVEGGSGGLHCYKSYASSSGELYLTVEYKVRIPLPYFTIPTISKRESLHMKGWTGYEKAENGLAGNALVYVTLDGMVYHKDYHCTYLQLSIHMVPSGSLGQLRNDSGGRYYACELCVRGNPGSGVFITDTGTRYHNSIGCSGLKRTIFTLPLSAVGERGACSRCGQ